MIRQLLIAIILIIGGVLASYGIVISKAPDLKNEYDKIIPYQGIIGVILILLGFWDLIHLGNLIGTFSAVGFFWGLVGILAMVTKFVLGIVLSFGLVTKYILSGKKTKGKKKSKKGDKSRQDNTNELYKKLTLVQVPFGIIAILIGLLAIGLIFASLIKGLFS